MSEHINLDTWRYYLAGCIAGRFNLDFNTAMKLLVDAPAWRSLETYPHQVLHDYSTEKLGEQVCGFIEMKLEQLRDQS